MTELSRVTAAQILRSCIEDDKDLSRAVGTNQNYKKLKSNDKNFCMLLVNECFRHIGQIDMIVDKFLSHPDKIPLDVRFVLRVASAEWFFTNSPVYAVVNNAVNSVSSMRQDKLKGLTNAVVRKICKMGKEEINNVNIKYNFPQWLVEIWTKQYGEEKTQGIMENSLKRYPLYINVKSDPEKWEKELNAKQVMPNLLRCEENINVVTAPGFLQGEWWVQGFESSLPVRLLGDIKGKKVLDCCAAPGGKTAQLVNAGANVIAIDKSHFRIRKLEENVKRLKMDVVVKADDAITYNEEKDFDAILIDAPCSATGTIRKNPDVLYNKNQQQIGELKKIQKGILDNMSKLVKVGGIIVYATCSLQQEEGESQVNTFLRENENFKISKVRGKDFFGFTQLINRDGMVRILPQDIDENISSDGFFMAKLERMS
jgi:16S rRNA (cytosine967-C5)-methyltransferase